LKATTPSPANNAADQKVTLTLTWTNGGYASNYDVYFGTNPVPGISEFKINTTNTSYSVGPLAENTQYYWRIDANNATGKITGDVWTFRTLLIPLPQMYGWWKFDETIGTTAADSSGKGNSGTLINGPMWVYGYVNNGLEFDGIDDYVDLPDDFNSLQAGLTVNVWAYPTAVKNWARFIDFGNGSTSDNILFSRYSDTNNLTLEVWKGSTSGGHVIATEAIELNRWQMFTATLDSSGNTRLYKDGVLIKTGTTAVPNDITRVNNYIGRSNWGADAYYQGIMDEVRIYNYPLTQAEIQTIYNGG